MVEIYHVWYLHVFENSERGTPKPHAFAASCQSASMSSHMAPSPSENSDLDEHPTISVNGYNAQVL